MCSGVGDNGVVMLDYNCAFKCKKLWVGVPLFECGEGGWWLRVGLGIGWGK